MSISYKIVAVKFNNPTEIDTIKNFFEYNNKLRYKAKYV